MKEYSFRGSLTLDGVTFFIRAENEAEAIKKARAGHYDDCDERGSSADNWEIDPDTLVEEGDA